jgi:glutamate-1-semialdehyde 2,1-aminomutase
VFAKAISNGYPMAAIVGTGDAMQAAQETFISSTCWTERIGPAAALATIRKQHRVNAPQRLIESGARVQTGWREAAARLGLAITVSGMPPLAHFQFDTSKPQALRTLFTQGMLERGFLATNAYYATCAHTGEQIDCYLAAAADVFAGLVKALEAGDVEKRLKGPVAHEGFYRLN